MGKTTEELNVKITGNSARAKAALSQTEKSIKGVGDRAKRTGALLKNFKQNWVSITAVTAGLILVTKKLVDAYAIQEKAQITLAAAMKQAGTFTEAAFQENLKFASSLQKMTAFGDEAILGVQKMLTNFGVEGEAMKGLTRATLDLAAAKGMDLRAAADLVAKSVGSSTNALTRYGIEVTGAAGSTERMEEAVENITKIFGGAAVAEADTFAGSVQQLKNVFGDFMETIGETISKFLKPLVKLLKGLSVVLIGMPESVRILGIAMIAMFAVAVVGAKLFGASLTVATGGLSLLVGAVVAGAVLMVQHWDKVKFAFDVAWTAIQIGLLRAAAVMIEIIPKMFGPWFVAIDLIIGAINLVADTQIQTLTETTEKLKESIDGQLALRQEELATVLKIEAEKKGAIEKSNKNSTKVVQSELQKQVAIYIKGLDKLKTVFNDVTKLIDSSSKIIVDSIISGFEDAEVSAKAIFAKIAGAFINLFSGELAALAAKEAGKAIAMAITLNPKAILHGIAAAKYTAAAVGLQALKPSIVGAITSAAQGADFVTEGPQLLMVGDNPSGRERVSVEPSEGGGGGMTFIIHNLTVMANDAKSLTDQLFDIAEQSGARPFRRGAMG